MSIVSTKQAAEILGTTPGYVGTLVRRGKLRQIPERGAGTMIFERATVEALAAARKKAHPWAGKAVPPKRPKGVQ